MGLKFDGTTPPDPSLFREPLLVAGPKVAWQIDAQVVKAGEVVRLPYVQVGEWEFRDAYGFVPVTEEDLDHVVANFHKDVRRQDIPLLVNEEHDTPPDGVDVTKYIGPGAIGYLRDLEREGDMVWAHVEPNSLGEQLLKQDRYRYTSPELILDWFDPQTGQSHGMTAAGLALTTMPRMKNLGTRGVPLAAKEGRQRALVLGFADTLRFAVNTDPSGVGGPFGTPTGSTSTGGPWDFTGLQAHIRNGHGLVTTGKTMDQLNAMHKREHVNKGSRDPVHSHDPGDAATMADVGSVHVDRPMANLLVAYAYPKTKRLPLNSAAAIKGAMARFNTIEAAEDEKQGAWQSIRDAGTKFDVQVPDHWSLVTAAEVRRWLLAEGDAQSELSELPICIYQPPYAAVGVCPGWTRNDDNDKDTDVCLMALRGCNGYVPCPTDQLHGAVPNQFGNGQDGTDWATSALPDNPAYYSEGGAMTPEEQAAAEAAKAKAKTATVTTPPASEPAKPAATSNAPSAADFAEMGNRVQAAENEAKAARAEAKAAQDELNANKNAVKLSETARELSGLVREGRITPAEAEVYQTNMALFAEQPFLLEALKKRPVVVRMDEAGRGGERPQGSSDSEGLHQMAIALMSERKQDTNIKAKTFHDQYRVALLDVSKTGFQGGTA